ncbi:MAG: hypothetical protein ACJAZY_000830 [Spirosomataceae bacterium]|jgi:hypothetical protein
MSLKIRVKMIGDKYVSVGKLVSQFASLKVKVSGGRNTICSKFYQ